MNILQRMLPLFRREPVVHYSPRVAKSFIRQRGEARALRVRADAWDSVERLNQRLILLVPQIVAGAASHLNGGFVDIGIDVDDLALVLDDTEAPPKVVGLRGGAVFVLYGGELGRVFGPFDAALREQGLCLERVEFHKGVVLGGSRLRFTTEACGV